MKTQQKPLQPNHTAMGRVNHAGEKGACAIYAGHLLGLALKRKKTRFFEELCAQEIPHVQFFQKFNEIYGIKSTPFEGVLCALGWSTAVLAGLAGPQFCSTWTHAIEDVIENHYRGQCASLHAQDPLLPWLQKFADEEASHGHHAAQETPHGGQRALAKVIRGFTRMAIGLAKWESLKKKIKPFHKT